MEGTRAGPRVEHPRCPYCKEAVRPDEAKQACDACMSWHHADCWAEYEGRCSACGGGRAVGQEEPPAADVAASEPRWWTFPAGEAAAPAESPRPEPLLEVRPATDEGGGVLGLLFFGLPLSPALAALLILILTRLLG